MRRCFQWNTQHLKNRSSRLRIKIWCNANIFTTIPKLKGIIVSEEAIGSGLHMVNLSGFRGVGHKNGKHDAVLTPIPGELLQGDPLQKQPKERSASEWTSGTSY